MWYKRDESCNKCFQTPLININVYVYNLISPWVHQTAQFTPLVWELSLIRSHLPCLLSAFNFLQLMPFITPQFSFHQVPHHCWVGRGSMEWEVCPTLLYLWPAMGIEPQTFWSWVQHPIHWATCWYQSEWNILRSTRYPLTSEYTAQHSYYCPHPKRALAIYFINLSRP